MINLPENGVRANFRYRCLDPTKSIVRLHLPGGRTEQALVADLSLGSARIFVAADFAIGTRFTIQFPSLPDVHLEAKVLWYQPHGETQSLLRCELAGCSPETLAAIVATGAFEQREYERIGTFIPVEVLLPGESKARVARLSDYSNGGFNIRLPMECAPTSFVVDQILKLWLPDSNSPIYGLVRQVGIAQSEVSIGVALAHKSDYPRLQASVKQVEKIITPHAAAANRRAQ